MRLRAAAAFLSLSFVARLALAEGPVPSLDLRGFHPPADPEGTLYLERSRTPGPGNFDLGAYASYALRPVVLSDASGRELASVVRHQVSLDYYAGLGIGETWGLSVAVPTILYQTGDDASALLPGSEALHRTTVGAIGVGLKKTLISPSDLGGLGVALLGRVDIPTDARSYASDHSVGGELRALGEIDLLALAIRATAGFHLRGEASTFVRDGTDRYRFGNDVPWGAAVSLRPQAFGIDREGHLRFSVEARGSIATTPKLASGPQSPAVGGLSARYTAKDVSALLGVEVPLDDAVGNPLVRPVLGVAWAPRVEDADHDGIEDDRDECPELEEDKDGFEDEDGCPDFDDDDDGVPDETDQCKKEKEDVDGFQDDDGCPDPDNDGDGVLDAEDACPNEKGERTGKRPGCPDLDRDGDGIPNDKDRCPDAAEDRDGFEDADGCPDPDNDGDGVPDAEDACPAEKGEPNAARDRNGCVNPDHDGDTYDDAEDRCPKEPEDFDGVEDEDGCPDAKNGAPLATIVETPEGKAVKFRAAPRFKQDEVDPRSVPALRALGAELVAHPDYIALVGVKAAGTSAKAEQSALNRAFSIALELRFYTHRDASAETVSFAAVKSAPGATGSGVGVIVLSPPAAPAATPAPPVEGAP